MRWTNGTASGLARPAVRSVRTLGAVAAVVAVVVASLAGGPSLTAQALPSGIAVGTAAPGAAVRTLGGQPADLRAYVGKSPVVIEFWGKWCGNCRALEPAMRAAHERYGDRVRFVTVAVSVDETPSEVADYARAHSLPSPVVYDETGAAVDAYDVPGTSFLVVLDRHGTVVYTGAGGTQDVDAAVRKAL
jgi:thiol-disulfide isomerase/thioredoxin